MEENLKKGARDISDLKARLGLKKGTPLGVPGAASEAPVPGPPGFGPPLGQAAQVAEAPVEQAPAGPPPPDPRRDPFAQQPGYGYGYGMPLPGVDDGKPAEQLSKPTSVGKVAGYVVLGLVALGGGFGSGRSCKAREDYNMTTEQAGGISREVDELAKVLNKVSERMAQSKELAAGNPDVKLAEDLGAMNLKEPDMKKVFHTNYYSLEDLAIDRLFNFYNDNIRLYALIEDHAKKTKGDEESIEKYVKDAAARGEKNYGIIFDLSAAIPLANLVEMGSLVCPTEGETNCSPDVMKFKYRTQAGAEWSQRPVKGKQNETVTPIFRTPMFAAVASGNPDTVAAQSCARRMAEIRILSAKISGEQKELQESLKRASDRNKVFTL